MGADRHAWCPWIEMLWSSLKESVVMMYARSHVLQQRSVTREHHAIRLQHPLFRFRLCSFNGGMRRLAESLGASDSNVTSKTLRKWLFAILLLRRSEHFDPRTPYMSVCPVVYLISCTQAECNAVFIGETGCRLERGEMAIVPSSRTRRHAHRSPLLAPRTNLASLSSAGGGGGHLTLCSINFSKSCGSTAWEGPSCLPCWTMTMVSASLSCEFERDSVIRGIRYRTTLPVSLPIATLLCQFLTYTSRVVLASIRSLHFFFFSSYLFYRTWHQCTDVSVPVCNPYPHHFAVLCLLM